MTQQINIILFLVFLFSGSIAPVQGSPTCPNEPVGATVVVDGNFDTVTCGRQFQDVYNSGQLTTLTEAGMLRSPERF